MLGDCEYDPAIIKSSEKIVPKSPGQKYRHYHPKAEVILYKGDLQDMVDRISKDYEKFESEGKKVGIMSTVQTNLSYSNKKTICVGDRGELLTISSNIFKHLRLFDQEGVDIILVESINEQGLGKAIMNRLTKASNKTILV